MSNNRALNAFKAAIKAHVERRKAERAKDARNERRWREQELEVIAQLRAL